MLLYTVELEQTDRKAEKEWEIWHEAHIAKLAEVPGIRSAQRFRLIGETLFSYLAIYVLDNKDVLQSAAYRSVGGPASASMWHSRLRDWHRNLLEGPKELPALQAGTLLHMIDRLGAIAPALPVNYSRFLPIGLDKTIEERGICILSAIDELPAHATHTGWSAKTFQAISPARVRQSSQ